MTDHHLPNDPSWFERPENIRKMIIALCVVCVVVLVAELFYENPHPHFDLEKVFGFHAWYGFAAFILIVFLGWVLRQCVGRKEDYYDQ